MPSPQFIRRLLMILTVVSFFSPSASADDRLSLFGRVQESVFKTNLPNAWVWTIGEDGERVDSIQLGFYSPGQFKFETSSKDSLYVFEVGCEGYTTQTFTYRVENAKNDWKRDIPTFYLDRAPHKLNELTVTTSKVKFYHRGDTLVYNADAFQLAEGSMLDGLIKQLPGAELSSNGRISINGEFVETLLLDGKPFFDGNNNLMLKNLGAYMVKNVEVYRAQTKMEKFMDEPPTHLTMNVRLKKEYNIGLIVNTQAGYGTDDRYMGRFFAAWFNPRTRIGLVANVNNLSDTGTPGEDGSWNPEQMPTGTLKHRMAGVTYNHSDSDDRNSIEGNVIYESNTIDSRTSTDRTNFFSTGNTYEYARQSSRNKDFSISTQNRYNSKISRVMMNGNLNGAFIRQNRHTSSTSASFNREQTDAVLNNLQAVYDIPTPETLSAIINRSITAADGSSKKGSFLLKNNFIYKVPFSRGSVRFSSRLNYDTSKDRLWDDYDIAYGYNPAAGGPADSRHRRNFTDKSPANDLGWEGTVYYFERKNGFSLNVGYDYVFNRRVRDSYMYALDRLADMGIYGTLPVGYTAAFDAANSFTSTQWDNRHSGILKLGYMWANLSIDGGMTLGVQHSRLDYLSDGRFYPIRRNSVIATIAAMQTHIHYNTNLRNEKKTLLLLDYEYTLDTETPDLLHTVDVFNTSDPLNISLGNPDLKNAYKHSHRLSVVLFNNRNNNNKLDLTATHTTDALLRGYAYDMQTGVRYNRTYNVRGNYTLGASDGYYLQFGRRKQFTLQSTTSAGLIHSVEMIGEISGEDSIDPAPSKVNNRNLSESLKLSWQIGRQTLSAIGKVTDTRTTRQRYADINATHWNYGLQGQFALPAGFGISTDFTCYTRRGYGVKELDTTDAVWNARITYTPRGGHWVIAVDGFDLLHQLSNVNYAVTATGRTVTVTNTLPRYILASVQYRFNITPKRR